MARERVMNAIITGDEFFIGTMKGHIRLIITKKNYQDVAQGKGGSLYNRSVWNSGLKASTIEEKEPEEIFSLLRKFYRKRIPEALIQKAEQYD